MSDRPHHGRPGHRPVVFDPESGRWEVSPADRSNPSIPPLRHPEAGERPRPEPLDPVELHTARHRRAQPSPETGSAAPPGPRRTRTRRRIGFAAAFVGTFLLGYLLGGGAAASPGTPSNQHAGASTPAYVGAAPAHDAPS